MPAKSVNQQQFFAMVPAKQKGELEDGSPAITKAAKSMKKKDVKDFASTKHKGLPKKVKNKEKVEEAFGQKVELYVQIINRWLATQGYNEYEIDAIFDDPDNMDIIINTEDQGGHPIEDAAKKLRIEEIFSEMYATEKHFVESGYVNESVDNFGRVSKISP